MNHAAATQEFPAEVRTCETHGEYESKNYIGRVWSQCPECSAKAAAEERRKEELASREAIANAWRQRIGNSGIPSRFSDRTLETFVAANSGQQRALEFAISYASEFDGVLKTGRSALFCGKPGTGKTHLAIGIGLKIMQERRTVLFVTVMRAIRRVKSTWDRGSSETETQAIAVMTSPDLLILDEIGIQFGSETEKNILFDVINDRYESRKPTLLLSNLTPKEVQTFLGERVFDRMREDGGVCIPFDWQSHRRQAS